MTNTRQQAEFDLYKTSDIEQDASQLLLFDNSTEFDALIAALHFYPLFP